MALVLEYERRRRYPILIFEQVDGYDIPIVANVVASRRALAFALGVRRGALAAEYGRRIKEHIKPVVVDESAVPRIASSRAMPSTWPRCRSRSTSPAMPDGI